LSCTSHLLGGLHAQPAPYQTTFRRCVKAYPATVAIVFAIVFSSLTYFSAFCPAFGPAAFIRPSFRRADLAHSTYA